MGIGLKMYKTIFISIALVACAFGSPENAKPGEQALLQTETKPADAQFYGALPWMMAGGALGAGMFGRNMGSGGAGMPQPMQLPNMNMGQMGMPQGMPGMNIGQMGGPQGMPPMPGMNMGQMGGPQGMPPMPGMNMGQMRSTRNASDARDEHGTDGSSTRNASDDEHDGALPTALRLSDAQHDANAWYGWYGWHGQHGWHSRFPQHGRSARDGRHTQYDTAAGFPRHGRNG